MKVKGHRMLVGAWTWIGRPKGERPKPPTYDSPNDKQYRRGFRWYRITVCGKCNQDKHNFVSYRRVKPKGRDNG